MYFTTSVACLVEVLEQCSFYLTAPVSIVKKSCNSMSLKHVLLEVMSCPRSLRTVDTIREVK